MFKLYKKNTTLYTNHIIDFCIKKNIKYISMSKSLSKYNKVLKILNLKMYNNLEHSNENVLVFGLYTSEDYERIKNHKGSAFVMFTGRDCLNIKIENLNNIIKYLKHINTTFISTSKDIYNKLKEVNVTSHYIYLDFIDKPFLKKDYNSYLTTLQSRYTTNNIINETFDKNINYSKKIVCVTCAYKREELLDYVIKYLSNLNELYKIIVVGSNDDERKIVEKYEICEYHEYENLPLSNKWNKGVLEARKYNPDAILIMGSDDIVSKDYLKYGKYLLSKNYDFIGCRSWLTIIKDGSTVIDSAFVGYRNNRSGNEPIGAGRIISKTVLDALDWNLYKFDTPINKGLDFNSYKKVLNIKNKKLNFKLIYPTNTIYMAGIKDVKYEHISVSHGNTVNKDIPGSSWYKWQMNAFSNPRCLFYTDYCIQEFNNVNHLENIGIVV